MDTEEIREDENTVEEETTPETDEQAVEQRSDDYDGIVRRLNEIFAEIASFSAKLDAFMEAGSLVDSGAAIRDVEDDDSDPDIIEEDAEDYVAIEDLDLEL